MISCPVIGQRAGSLPPIGHRTALLHGEIWKFLEPLEASKSGLKHSHEGPSLIFHQPR